MRVGEAAATASATSAGAYFLDEMIRHETDDTRRAELQQAVDSAGQNGTVLNDAAASVVGRLMNVDVTTATRMVEFIQRAGTTLDSTSTENHDGNARGGGATADVGAQTPTTGTWIGANAALNSMLRESNLTARGGRWVVAGSEADASSTDAAAAAQVSCSEPAREPCVPSPMEYSDRGELGHSTHTM
jgi:hypothetical protein